jgi:hypothetical protein
MMTKISVATQSPTYNTKEKKASKSDKVWYATLHNLLAWQSDNGHMPRESSTDLTEKSLARWLTNQRKAKSVGKLHSDRSVALEAAGIPFAPKSDLWKGRLLDITAWAAAHNGADPQESSKDAEEKSLAVWLKSQRLLFKKGTLPEERANALKSAGFDLVKLPKTSKLRS